MQRNTPLGQPSWIFFLWEVEKDWNESGGLGCSYAKFQGLNLFQHFVLFSKYHRSRKVNEKLHEYFIKVIVLSRVRSTSGIFHFHKIRLQSFINSSRTKVGLSL